QARDLLRSLAARAGGRRRDRGGRKGGLVVTGLPGVARGTDASGARRLPPARRVRLLLRGGRPFARANAGSLPPARGAGPPARRGAAAALRRRPPPRPGADRPFPRRLRL